MPFDPVLAIEFTSATVTIIVIVVAGLGFVIYLATSQSFRTVLNVPVITMPKNKSVTLTAKLQRKGWVFGAWADVPGAYTVLVNAAAGVLGPSPQAGTTTAAAPTTTITVVGTAVGKDRLKVTFIPTGLQEKVTAGADLTVTEG